MANADRIINVTNNLANITNVINNLPNYLNTSDANAVASEIYKGQTAYVNGVKLSGTCTWTDALAGGTITELETLADNILGINNANNL